MSYYLLDENYALRTFTDEPYVLVSLTGHRFNPVKLLTKDEFDTLSLCDGTHRLPASSMISQFIADEIIHEVDSAKHGLAYDQRPRDLGFRYRSITLLSITGRCNLNCRHCLESSDAQRTVDIRDLTREEVLHIIDQLPAIGVEEVWLIGGEPLVSPHFREYVQQITQRHLRFTRLVTNAFLVNEDLLTFIKNQGQDPVFYVSFDGLGEHNWMRNHPHAEEITITAIQTIIRHGFRVACVVQVNRRTAPRLVETCRFLRELGVIDLALMRTVETPRWVENEWGNQSTTVSECHELCYQVVKAAITEKWHISISQPGVFSIPAEPRFEEVNIRVDDHYSVVCGKEAESFVVSHNGTLLPCILAEGMLAANGQVPAENLKAVPVETALREQKLNMTLRDIRNYNPDCQACEYFLHCGGGCRCYGYAAAQITQHATYGEGQGGSFLHKDPALCSFFKEGYYKKMKAMLLEVERERDILI